MFFTGINIPRNRITLPALILTQMFAGVAFIDLIHLLSSADMPDFITPNSEQKAIVAWLFGRVLTAVALLAAVFMRQNAKVNKKTWFCGSIAALLYTTIATLVSIYISAQLPAFFIKGVGVTPLKRVIEYGLVLLNIVTLLRIAWLFKVRSFYYLGEKLAVAVAFMGLFKLTLSSYLAGSDIFNLYGHFLKVLAYYYLYQAILQEFIQRPYDQLALSEQQLTESIKQVRQANQRIEKQNTELTHLYDLALSIVHRLDLTDVLKEAVDKAIEIANASYGYIAIVEEHSDIATLRYATGFYENFIGLKVMIGEGVAGRVLNTRQPMVVEDYNNWVGRLPVLNPQGRLDVAAVPLIVDDRVVGVIGISYLNRTFQGKEVMDMLEKFAAMASIVIDNSALYQQAKREIKERIIAERALADSEAKYRLLAEHSSDVIWTTNSRGIVTYISPSVRHVIGEGTNGLLDISVLDLVSGQAREDLAEYISSGSVSTRILEGEVISIDNKNITPVEIIISPLGTQAGFLGTFRDISDRKAAETARLEAQKREARLERLASLGTMVAAVAHEISQPLQSISILLGELPFLHRRGVKIEIDDVIRNCTLASKQTYRIERTVERLRSFVQRGDSLTYNYVRISDVISGALQVVGEQLKVHGVKIVTDIPEDLTIWCDQHSLEEALINLAINSMQAMDEAKSADKVLFIRVTAEEQFVNLELSDTGTGIKDEIMPNLFQPFFTTKKGSSGMGLGLAITESIVSEHGGTICVENQKTGASFVIKIPRPSGETKSNVFQ